MYFNNFCNCRFLIMVKILHFWIINFEIWVDQKSGRLVDQQIRSFINVGRIAYSTKKSKTENLSFGVEQPQRVEPSFKNVSKCSFIHHYLAWSCFYRLSYGCNWRIHRIFLYSWRSGDGFNNISASAWIKNSIYKLKLIEKFT